MYIWYVFNNTFLLQLSKDDPAWAGKLDQKTHCGPFQLYSFCDSVKKVETNIGLKHFSG